MTIVPLRFAAAMNASPMSPDSTLCTSTAAPASSASMAVASSVA
jgi:hypothetical protein